MNQRALVFLYCLAGPFTATSLPVLSLPPTVTADTLGVTQDLIFTREVVNFEVANRVMFGNPPRILRGSPSAEGEVYYGAIDRRVGAENSPVTFAAMYQDGVPVASWCDINMNGDLSDDSPLPMFAFPGSPRSRAALVDLSWVSSSTVGSLPISWKMRIVFDPKEEEALPRYRLQQVYAMAGRVPLAGKPHRAVLYDGDSNGTYGKQYGDGMFIDLDDDGAISVDLMSSEFLPFSVPVPMGSVLMQTEEVSPDGTRITLKPLGSDTTPVAGPILGEMAPDFELISMDGRPMSPAKLRGSVVAVYFWAAWCGICGDLSREMQTLYQRYHDRGFEVLGISMDEDWGTLTAFQESHREPWPVSYAGRKFWEHPVARLYGVRATGAIYLIDAEGKFAGLYYDFQQAARTIENLLAGAVRPAQE